MISNTLVEDDDLYFFLAENLVNARVKLRGFFGHRYDHLIDFTKAELISWAKDNLHALLDDSVEIIKRNNWDLLGLRGATLQQLQHPHFDIVRDYLFMQFQPTSSVAALMLCSNKKPYSTNNQLKQYIRICKKHNVDFYIVSNPGIIPIAYDNYYPFRWYEWPEDTETESLKKSYIEVIQQRIEDWFNHFTHYTKVVSLLRCGETSVAFNKAQIKQTKVSVLTKYKDPIYAEYAPRFAGYAGWERSRIINLKMVKEYFIEEICNE